MCIRDRGFADGPWGVVPGGSFAETSQPAPADWSFAKEYDTVEFQLEEPVSSRTSWIMEHNNRIFIPSGYMNSTVGKIWKQWPMHAEKNGNALLRIDGQVFEVRMQRTKEAAVLAPILSELARKYMGDGATHRRQGIGWYAAAGDQQQPLGL